MHHRLEQQLSLNNQILGAAMFALLAGCMATPDQPNGNVQKPMNEGAASVSSNEAAPMIDTAVLPSYTPGRVTFTARTSGILQRQGSCLVVVHGNAPGGDVLIFPEGAAQWDSASETLVYKNISTKIGAKIDLGGGAINIDEAGVKIANLAADCKAKFVWLVG